MLWVSDVGVTLNLDHVLDFVLSVDLKLSPDDNSSLTVALHNREKKQAWYIHYTCSSQVILAKVSEHYLQYWCDVCINCCRS